jgi:hypothetical protein
LALNTLSAGAWRHVLRQEGIDAAPEVLHIGRRPEGVAFLGVDHRQTPVPQTKVSGIVNGSLTEALVSSKGLQTCRGNLHNEVRHTNQRDSFNPTFIDNCGCSSPTANALAHQLLAIH